MPGAQMVFAAFNILLIMSLSVCCCVQYATFYFHYSLHEKFHLHQNKFTLCTIMRTLASVYLRGWTP